MSLAKYPQANFGFVTYFWLWNKFKCMAAASEHKKLSPFMTEYLINSLEKDKIIKGLEDEIQRLKEIPNTTSHPFFSLSNAATLP